MEASDSEIFEDARDFFDKELQLKTVTSKGPILKSFLKDVGLQQHFPNKLSLSTVLQIDKSTVTDDPAQSLSDLPWLFLKKLMMGKVTFSQKYYISFIMTSLLM
ncbi:hypothetical protein HF521_019769 [Silurus meridionalis]|uniref:Uncharacterized protein n=1 Tax=Silurus meridionalis TaxID=175797 RepID=A0A8T0BHS2_SILME|nr:hypothetical protein HF521_019769 [Silurus meridionalis]